MAETADKPSIDPDGRSDEANSQIGNWALHLAVLLSIVVALLWLQPAQSSSPAAVSVPRDSVASWAVVESPSLSPPEGRLKIAPSPTAPSETDQGVERTEEIQSPPVFAVPTAVPEMGDRQRHLNRLLTSRGGARPASPPTTLTLIRNAVPHTIIPDRPRLNPITYTVQTGDTLLGVAEEFGLEGDTIMWASGRLEDHPDLLHVGQVLTILPVDGVYHTVQKGDTLESVAKKYKADVEAIIQCEYNALEEPYELTSDQKLIVPGGKKPYVPRVVHAYSGQVPASAAKGTGLFGWPVSGAITQKFWARHQAIDIGAPTGRSVVAADSGYVAESGWSEYGYGRYVIIEHGNGFQTLYAHLSAILVKVGQSVGKGARIGSVGSTGRATGPHLHFEIRYKGVQRNPFGYLP